jgi:hypothetical protein
VPLTDTVPAAPLNEALLTVEPIAPPLAKIAVATVAATTDPTSAIHRLGLTRPIMRSRLNHRYWTLV